MVRAGFNLQKILGLGLVVLAIPSTAEAVCDGTGNGLRVMTFNAQLAGLIMDGFVSDYGGVSDEERAAEIAKRVIIADPDVVVFQEVWNDTSFSDLARDVLIEDLQDKYPHSVWGGGGCGGLESSGLLIVSKWPFFDLPETFPGPVNGFGDGGWGDTESNLDKSNQARLLCFDDLRWPDQLADKGVMQVKIAGECGIRSINLFTAHAQANHSMSVQLDEECRRCEEREFQRKNLGDIRFMMEHLLSNTERASEYVIFGGDLNIAHTDHADPANPTNPSAESYCEGNTDHISVCYSSVYGAFGSPAHVDTTYSFMFNGFTPAGTSSAFEHNEFFSCTRPAIDGVVGDADVCPANAFGGFTANTPFLVDSYLTEHPSTHTLAGNREVNDFILHNKPRLANGGTVRSCMQHLREGNLFTGLSDHMPLIADFNDTAPRCSPFPWKPTTGIPATQLPPPEFVDAPNNNSLSSTWGPEYVFWDLQDVNDVDRLLDGHSGAAGFDAATRISMPGNVQWYLIYQPATWNIKHSASVQVDVYQAKDLSKPISFSGNCKEDATDLDGSDQTMVQCTYAGYEPPYYVKVYGWNKAQKKENRNFSGPYRIKFHRRNCSSLDDACPLSPQVAVSAVFPSGQMLGADDKAFFTFDTEEDVARNFPAVEMELTHKQDAIMSTVFGGSASCDPLDCPGIPFEEQVLDATATAVMSPWVVNNPAPDEMMLDPATGRWTSARQPTPAALPGDDRGNGSFLYTSTANYYGFPKTYVYTVRRRNEVSPTYYNTKINFDVRYTTPLTYFGMTQLICHQERTDVSDWGIEDDIAFQMLVPGSTEHHVTVAGAAVTAPPVCNDPSHPQCSYLPNSGDCEPGEENLFYDHNFHRALRQSSTTPVTLNPWEDAIDGDFYNLGANTLMSLGPTEPSSAGAVSITGDDWDYEYHFFRSHLREEVQCVAANGDPIAGACDLAGMPGYTGSSGYRCCVTGPSTARAGHCTDCAAAGFGAGCGSPPSSTTCF